jgi:hypothetical protein
VTAVPIMEGAGPGVRGRWAGSEADPPNGALEEERVARRLAAADAARRAHLDRIVKDQARCRVCGARLTDEVLARSPGLCTQRACRRAARGTND